MNCPATGKIGHKTRRHAILHLAALRRIDPGSERMAVFRCEACGRFHLGYDALTSGDRITESYDPELRAAERYHQRHCRPDR